MGSLKNNEIEEHLLEEACHKLQSIQCTAATALIHEDPTKHFSGRFAVIDVLCAAYVISPENKVDWYSILQLPTWADAYALDRQYKRFVELFEPIKMSFFGAETALNLVEEAYAVLSDPTKRAMFDSERNGTRNESKELNFLPPCKNVNGNPGPISIVGETLVGSCIESPLMGRTLEIEKKKDFLGAGYVVNDSTRNDIQISSPDFSFGVGERPLQERELDEFPNSHDEESKEKLNFQRNSEVLNADEVIHSGGSMPMAGAYMIELPSPSNMRRSSDNLPPQENFGQLKKKIHTQESSLKPRGIGEEEVNDVVFGTTDKPTPRIHTNSSHNVKRSFENLLARDSFDQLMKEHHAQEAGFPGIHMIELPSSCDLKDSSNRKLAQEFTDHAKVKSPTQESAPKEKTDEVFYASSNSTKKLSDKILAKDSFDLSRKKVCSQKRVCDRIDEQPVETKTDVVTTKKQKLEYQTDVVTTKQPSKTDVVTTKVGSERMRVSLETSTTTSKETKDQSYVDTITLDQGVQESASWSDEDFEVGQIWAIYSDTPDAMPRSYVRVTNVRSSNRVSVTSLEPHPSNHKEKQWLKKNLPLACGVFRACWSTFTLDITRFSHPVEYEKNTQMPVYRILPSKGEIWAMYVGWSTRWTLCNLGNCQYHVVQILSDLSMESGIRVCRLVEVDEWMTFFQREYDHEGSLFTKTIPKSEFLCFSHRIPAYTVVGIENHGFSKRTWHLAPDALPPKFGRS